MNPRLLPSRHLAAAIPLCVAVFALTMAFGRSDLAGQGRAGGAPAPPQTGRALAPVDLTGTWVSVVTEDWRWRMVTPPRGDVASIPVSAEGRKAAASWNLDADNASGNQCKAYGIGGIMRQPGRLRISWQDDQTLKLEFDAGTQTRLLSFDRASQPPAERTLQGFSRAQWEGPGVGRGTGNSGWSSRSARDRWRVARARPARRWWWWPSRRSTAAAAGADQSWWRSESRDDELSGRVTFERTAYRTASRPSSRSTCTCCQRIPTATTGCTSSRSSRIRAT